jgi:hypothetical protein
MTWDGRSCQEFFNGPLLLDVLYGCPQERSGPGQNALSLSLSLSLVIATAKTTYLDVYSIKYGYYSSVVCTKLSGSNLLYSNDAQFWQQSFVYLFALEAVWCNDFFIKKIGLSCVCG